MAFDGSLRFLSKQRRLRSDAQPPLMGRVVVRLIPDAGISPHVFSLLAVLRVARSA